MLVGFQVSFKRRHIQVEVMELVRNLSIGGSSGAIAVGDKRHFVANISTGKPIRFLWTFDLQHHHHLKTTLMGKEVSCTFCTCSQMAPSLQLPITLSSLSISPPLG